ncbi:MAG: integrase arm-type DNA-binding domain-containing protein [Desulfobacteraceae bacterium]|nr:integrase arm-type DNA-binding domain-containing protein [Desulfobacteraceae bacterium]
MPLTQLEIRNAKPKDKPYKLFAGEGLFLLVTPNGGKWWRFKYRFGGKEKLLSVGTYPQLSLKEAGVKRDEWRRLLLSGIDPGQKRKAENVAQSGEGSFEAVAREWFEKKKGGWAVSHSEKIIARLENDVFPWLGAKPVNQVTAPDLLMVVRRIEERGAVDTAHRALQNCGQVFRYAIVTGRAERNPAADLHGALKPIRKEHYPDRS